MSFRFALAALFLSGSFVAAADSPKIELRTLAGKDLKGELVAIDAKTITLKSGEDEVKTPVEQVIELSVPENVVPGGPLKEAHVLVDLTDGTSLRCAQVEIKNKEAILHLHGAGQVLKVDLSLIKYLLNEANNEAIVSQWKDQVLGRKRSRDALVVADGGQINVVDGTFGDADAKGETIGFTLTSGKSVSPNLNKVQGLYFARPPLATALPLACKVYDKFGNVLMVSAVARTEAGVTLTLSGGPKVDYTFGSLARFDYSKGKLTFLSDLAPTKEVYSNTELFVQKYRKDKNLDDGPMTMKAIPYKKGLALHAHTELEYDLGGDYREFKAMVGFDDSVGGTEGPVLVILQGDGAELGKYTLDRAKDKGPLDLTVNVADVNRLRIVVKSGTLLDLGKHVELGNARVSK